MSLKPFQKENNIKPDGLIGPETMFVFKEKYKLSIAQTANFFGQTSHETGIFKYSQENLNYSKDRLRVIFSKYFQTEDIAKIYARNPEMIANRVYANRMGNGDEGSGDGWKYKGRGALQLSGFNNYKKFSTYTRDLNIISNPDIVATKYYLESALFFFNKNRIFNLAKDIDPDTITKITKKINGGYNGLEHRKELTIKYYDVLKRYEDEIKHKQNTSEVGVNSISGNDSDTISKGRNTKKETGKDPVRGEKVENKARLFIKIIRWILQKISSRHTN